MDLRKKEASLEKILRAAGSVLIAYSGGVDSSYLLYKAGQILGREKVLAATVISAIHPQQELRAARAFTAENGFEHLAIPVDVLSGAAFSSNSPARCYYCKRMIFAELLNVAQKHELARVCDGANLDDLGDYRPGLRAARELNVLSPLQQAELSKEEIRLLSREAGLKTWDLPAAACLATRIPYGEAITMERITKIGAGEELLEMLGLQNIRLRCHGKVARLEIDPLDFPRALENRDMIVSGLKKLGFTYITLDLEGFRSGSMNEMLQGG